MGGPRFVVGLKGHNKIAQGNALGTFNKKNDALKGRNNGSASQFEIVAPLRALPWAIVSRPFWGISVVGLKGQNNMAHFKWRFFCHFYFFAILFFCLSIFLTISGSG